MNVFWVLYFVCVGQLFIFMWVPRTNSDHESSLFLNVFKKNRKMDGSVLKKENLLALVENLSSVFYTHVRWLRTACDSSFIESAQFWLRQASAFVCTYLNLF